MGGILSPISNLFGWIMSYFYKFLSGTFSEPSQVSFFAITILMMAVISKLVTIPLTAQSMKSTNKMKNLQPKMEELQKKYGYDQRILNQKIQELYQEEGISMAGCSSCLPMIIQLVLIFALFNVLRDPAHYMSSVVKNFNTISRNFFWIQDLLVADPLRWVGLPLVNALLQLALQFVGPMRQQQEQMGGMNMMLYIMPVMFYFLSIGWASGLLLYWIFGNLLDLAYRGISFLFNRNRAKAIEGGRD